MKLNETHKIKPDNNPTALKIIRVNRGITQRQLAELSGVPIKTVRCYESRERDIKNAAFATVSALANALMCDPTDLLQD